MNSVIFKLTISLYLFLIPGSCPDWIEFSSAWFVKQKGTFFSSVESTWINTEIESAGEASCCFIKRGISCSDVAIHPFPLYKNGELTAYSSFCYKLLNQVMYCPHPTEAKSKVLLFQLSQKSRWISGNAKCHGIVHLLTDSIFDILLAPLWCKYILKS